MHVGENNRKDGQSTTIFSTTERKTSIEKLLLISMSDEENRSARKRMWKITSGVLIDIALKRPYNK